jgi:hypothetical protein
MTFRAKLLPEISVTSFADGVLLIFAWRSDEEMLGIEAGWIVTFVADHTRVFRVKSQPQYSRKARDVCFLSAVQPPRNAITIFILYACPVPTSIFINMETVNQTDASPATHFILKDWRMSHCPVPPVGRESITESLAISVKFEPASYLGYRHLQVYNASLGLPDGQRHLALFLVEFIEAPDAHLPQLPHGNPLPPPVGEHVRQGSRCDGSHGFSYLQERWVYVHSWPTSVP